MRIVARNLTPTSLFIDRKGHQLGGGEFGVVDTDDKVTADAIAAGNLGEVERPDGPAADLDPGAAAAFAALDADGAETAAGDGAAGETAAGETAAGDGAAGGGETAAAGGTDAGAPAATVAPAKTTTTRKAH